MDVLHSFWNWLQGSSLAHGGGLRLMRPGWIVHDSGRKRDYVNIKRKLVPPALPFKSEMHFLPCSGTFDASNIHIASSPPQCVLHFSFQLFAIFLPLHSLPSQWATFFSFHLFWCVHLFLSKVNPSGTLLLIFMSFFILLLKILRIGDVCIFC